MSECEKTFADKATKIAAQLERRGYGNAAQKWRDARWKAVDRGFGSRKWGEQA